MDTYYALALLQTFDELVRVHVKLTPLLRLEFGVTAAELFGHILISAGYRDRRHHLRLVELAF